RRSQLFSMSLAVAGAAFLLTAAAEAKVIHITITSRTPALKGQSFGKAGAYELVRGTATGELDPSDRRNAVITDIQFAPRNANGRVSYTTTFSILKPVDAAKSNGTLVYDVVNRGNVRFAARFTKFVLAAATPDPDVTDAGDGSLYKAGYIVLASGWQGDMPLASAAAGREAIDVPIAKNADGSPVTGPVTVRFAANVPGYEQV